MAKFCKGISGNPGGRPKVLGEVQELARQYAPTAIVELARLALKAKSETARITAIRELLDSGYGRPRQAMAAPAGDPLQLLFEELAQRSRGSSWSRWSAQGRLAQLRDFDIASCLIKADRTHNDGKQSHERPGQRRASGDRARDNPNAKGNDTYRD